jgi:hypothetical protein
MTWVGWVWRGGRWHLVCTGESIGDVARKLNALVQDVPTWHQCVTGGAPPTFRVKEKARHRTVPPDDRPNGAD